MLFFPSPLACCVGLSPHLRKDQENIKATEKAVVWKIREDKIKENLNLRKEHDKSSSKEIQFGGFGLSKNKNTNENILVYGFVSFKKNTEMCSQLK